jgi:hypothetical protein
MGRVTAERSAGNGEAAKNSAAAVACEDIRESSAERPMQSKHPAIRSAAKRKRRVQHVSTNQERRAVVQWMVAESKQCGTDKRIKTKAVSAFPQCFLGSAKANFMRASRWWNSRDKTLQAPARGSGDGANGMTLRRRRVMGKAAPGRGRKRAPWVEFLHAELLKEMERHEQPGHISPVPKLVDMARSVLQNSRGAFTHETKIGGVELIDKVNHRWIYSFIERFGIKTASGRRQKPGSASSSEVSETWLVADAEPPVQPASAIQ